MSEGIRLIFCREDVEVIFCSVTKSFLLALCHCQIIEDCNVKTDQNLIYTFEVREIRQALLGVQRSNKDLPAFPLFNVNQCIYLKNQFVRYQLVKTQLFLLQRDTQKSLISLCNFMQLTKTNNQLKENKHKLNYILGLILKNWNKLTGTVRDSQVPRCSGSQGFAADWWAPACPPARLSHDQVSTLAQLESFPPGYHHGDQQHLKMKKWGI